MIHHCFGVFEERKKVSEAFLKYKGGNDLGITKFQEEKSSKTQVLLTPSELAKLDELRTSLKNSTTIKEAEFYKRNIDALLNRGKERAFRAEVSKKNSGAFTRGQFEKENGV